MGEEFGAVRLTYEEFAEAMRQKLASWGQSDVTIEVVEDTLIIRRHGRRDFRMDIAPDVSHSDGVFDACSIYATAMEEEAN